MWECRKLKTSDWPIYPPVILQRSDSLVFHNAYSTIFLLTWDSYLMLHSNPTTPLQSDEKIRR